MPNMRGYHSDFLNDLDILLVEDSPTLEELEIQAFGSRVTGDLDGVLTVRFPQGPYPHQVDFNNRFAQYVADAPLLEHRPTTHPVDNRSHDFPPSPDLFIDQPFEFLERTASPLSPPAETPSQPPTPQPLPEDPKYVMELHIIAKAKGKSRGKQTAPSLTAMKSPVMISFNLTYEAFLEEVAKVADVQPSQLDRENMRWKHRKPATAPPTIISEGESYGIMVRAVRSKKNADQWIIVEMGQPLLSKAPWAPPRKLKYDLVDDDDSDRENTQRKVSVDGDVEEIIEGIKEKYPIGDCRTHPKNHCFSTPSGTDHWLLDRTKLVVWAGAIKSGNGSDKCPPILTPAFKNHKAKNVPETAPATTTSGATNPDLASNPIPTPVPNFTTPPFPLSHSHHFPSSYPSNQPMSWHGLSASSSCANCHPSATFHSCHTQPTYHNYQPQPIHCNCHPPPPIAIAKAYSHPPAGPPPRLTEQLGWNDAVINDFCATHGLGEAARDSLKNLMSGVSQ